MLFIIFIHFPMRTFALRLIIRGVIYYFIRFLVRIFVLRLLVHSPIRFLSRVYSRIYIFILYQGVRNGIRPISRSGRPSRIWNPLLYPQRPAQGTGNAHVSFFAGMAEEGGDIGALVWLVPLAYRLMVGL